MSKGSISTQFFSSGFGYFDSASWVYPALLIILALGMLAYAVVDRRKR